MKKKAWTPEQQLKAKEKGLSKMALRKRKAGKRIIDQIEEGKRRDKARGRKLF